MTFVFISVHAESLTPSNVPSIFPPDWILKGKVVDENSNPVAGASVEIKGTTRGTTTDQTGSFSLSVNNDEVIEINSLGFKTRVMQVGEEGAGPLTIRLERDEAAMSMNEVVIIGYGTARKRDLTGSIVSLKPSLSEAATAGSFDNLLDGKVAGVSIASFGSTPGSGASIIIRGANSLTGESQPLYVIDNVPQASTGQNMRNASGDFQIPQNPLASINPNDIEDIQILKDASATAIYGSRGANGVILITTKKGKKGKPKITAGANFTIAQPTDLIEVMNLKEYAQYLNEKNPVDPRFDIKGNEVSYNFQYEDSLGNLITTTKPIPDRNWLKEALRTAVSKDVRININGGGENVRYLFSSTYRDVQGVVQNTGLKHGDLRLNLGVDLSKKVTVNLNLSGYLRSNNMMPGGNATGRTTGAIIPTAINSQPFILPDNDTRLTEDNRVTVFGWINDYEDLIFDYKISASADITYKFIKNWSYVLRTGGNLNNTERDNWYGIGVFQGFLNNGMLSQNTLRNNNYNVENLINFNKTYNMVNVSATTGITYDAYSWLNTSVVGKQFPMYVLRENGLHTANDISVQNPDQRDYQLLSYLGRLNLSFYNGKYIVTGTFRSDGTSKFTKSKRWGYFPSVALAWNAKQETLFDKADWLSQFKVRAGYGVTGSQNISPYTSVFQYVSGPGYANPSGEIIQGLGVAVNNPNLIWETTSSFNGGIDFGFLNQRITGSLDIYTKNTKDLLLDFTLPASTSFNTLTVNNGEVSNKGVELMLNGDVIKTRDFAWSIGGNIAFNKARIEKLGVTEGTFASLGKIKAFYGSSAGDHFGSPNIFIEKEAPGLFYGFKTNGIVQTSDASDYKVAAPFTNSNTPGNLRVADVNEDGVVDINDRTIIGDPNPDYTYGFQTNLQYKGVRLAASFTGVKGGDIFNADQRYLNIAAYQQGDKNLRPEAVANAWRQDNQSNTFPSFASNIVNGYIYDRYLEDGSYLRCSDVTLGYNLTNQPLIRKINLSNVDVFVSVKNLFTITNYSGFDVTSRSFANDPLRRGFDLYSFPTQRAFILGLTVGF